MRLRWGGAVDAGCGALGQPDARAPCFRFSFVRVVAGALAVSFLLAAAAAAAPPPPGPPPPGSIPSREELNPAGQVAPPREAPRDIFSPEPPGPCPLKSSGVTFTLRSVVFRGDVVGVAGGDLAQAYQGLVGQTVPAETICEIRDRAARIFFDHGILARVLIPPQTIENGELAFEVIEAHVVNVRVRGDAGPAQAAVERYLDKLRGMNPFDMRKAQRYLLLASDIPGVRIQARIMPSVSGGRGEVDLDVIVSVRPVEATGNVQNYQANDIGPWSALARIDVRDLTGFGDDSSLVAYHTLGSNGEWVAQWLEEARLGAEGLVLRTSVVYGQTQPGGALAPADIKTDSLVGQVELAYPLVRLRHRNLELAAGFDAVQEKTSFASFSLYDENLRIFYLRADGDARLSVFSHPVEIAGQLSVRQGVAGLGASTLQSTDLARAGADPEAWVVRSQGDITAQIAGPLQFHSHFQAQYAQSPLVDYEQIALGDLTVGRGYDPAVVLGDSGAAGSLELRYVTLPPAWRIRASPYAFYDVGTVHDNGVALFPDRTLTSAGFGVVLNLAGRANLDLTFAEPFQPPFPGLPKPGPRVLLSLTAAFP
jgi:hemolysin activation/secretion protein